MSYTVWLGGVAMIERVEFSTALDMYYEYKDEGYTDIIIEEDKQIWKSDYGTFTLKTSTETNIIYIKVHTKNLSEQSIKKYLSKC